MEIRYNQEKMKEAVKQEINELPRELHVANPASFRRSLEQAEIDDRTICYGYSQNEFKARFSQTLAREQLQQIKQTGSITEYIAAFRLIMKELPSMWPSYDTRLRVMYEDPNTLEEAYRYAEFVDMVHMIARGPDLPVAPHGNGEDFQANGNFLTEQVTPMDMNLKEKIRKDEVNNFMQWSSFLPRRNRKTELKQIVCQYCHKPGHIKGKCRVRKADIAKLDQAQQQK
ncbi:hypothetical protein K450DRAFT_298056 [Umbelopsis ramanniana AG]|uniref:Retrotransposon gag domain-containing protein n=1 Tax=Umbelopsis ramanniana AG TaxID=1314678 RepID=A0AAD5HFE4_UMBRA|nr:uncharacterized protein K450DRAFT_298056 [Umbelopsis ramanniana AG]KAI8582360.1 hypothetical protein K450DRAFT_298056 [Umbelopsis ramanniana AG]